MRVLVVANNFPSPRNSVAGIFILRRLIALRELGHEFRVVRIVPFAPPIGAKWRSYHAIPDVETVQGFSVRTLRAIIPPRMLGMEYVAAQLKRALQREINRFHPDLVHASFLVPCGQLAVRQPLRSIVTTHGGDGYAVPFSRPGLYRACREALEKATRVTAVSDSLRQRIQEIVPREVRVIWNGADEQLFYPRDLPLSRQRLGLPLDRFIVAYAGPIARGKGLFDLVRATAQIESEYRPIILFAGAGPDKKALLAEAEHAAVDARFLGLLPQNGVAELFGAVDAVAFPSHNEGLPKVVCEAMLSQRVVLATAVGGIPEVIRVNRTGMLVSPHAPDELAMRLKELLADAQQRQTLARAARSFALKHLTWRVAARGYDELYHEVLSEPGSAII